MHDDLPMNKATEVALFIPQHIDNDSPMQSPCHRKGAAAFPQSEREGTEQRAATSAAQGEQWLGVALQIVHGQRSQ